MFQHVPGFCKRTFILLATGLPNIFTFAKAIAGVPNNDQALAFLYHIGPQFYLKLAWALVKLEAWGRGPIYSKRKHPQLRCQFAKTQFI